MEIAYSNHVSKLKPLEFIVEPKIGRGLHEPSHL